MKKTTGLFIIKNKTTGELYKTPKGRTTWNSVGAAKNAWNSHNYRKVEKTYNWALGPRTITRWERKKWAEDAGDWEVKQIAELVYKELDNE